MHALVAVYIFLRQRTGEKLHTLFPEGGGEREREREREKERERERERDKSLP